MCLWCGYKYLGWRIAWGLFRVGASYEWCVGSVISSSRQCCDLCDDI